MMTKNSSSDKKSKEVAKLKEWFKEEIERRDKIIDKLKEENKILIKTSFKQADKYLSLKEEMQKLKNK
jgi:hypothetical protein